jgi:hypothetical protein
MANFKKLSTPEEIFEASQLQIRDQDIMEFMGASGRPWQEALSEALQASDVLFGAYFDGSIEAVGGVVITEDLIIPWFVGSEVSHKYPRAWMRFGKYLVKILKGFNKPLENYIWSTNEDVKKWLTYIGFEVDASKSYERHFGSQFYKFKLIKEAL